MSPLAWPLGDAAATPARTMRRRSRHPMPCRQGRAAPAWPFPSGEPRPSCARQTAEAGHGRAASACPAHAPLHGRLATPRPRPPEQGLVSRALPPAPQVLRAHPPATTLLPPTAGSRAEPDAIARGDPAHTSPGPARSLAGIRPLCILRRTPPFHGICAISGAPGRSASRRLGPHPPAPSAPAIRRTGPGACGTQPPGRPLRSSQSSSSARWSSRARIFHVRAPGGGMACRRSMRDRLSRSAVWITKAIRCPSEASA